MRRREVVVGGAILACVAAIAVYVVVARGGPHHGRPQSSSGNQMIGAGPSGGGGPSSPAPSSTAVPSGTAAPGGALPVCARPSNSAASGGWSLIATTKGSVSRYDRPGGPVEGTIPASWYGGVSALPVIARRPGWLEVRLATRPNGSTGWIRQADTTVTATPYWISVDLATRHLSLFRLNQKVMSAPAGVGTGRDPTPMGQYFVAFFEASPSAGYGPFILVTSAHSTSIANWEGSGDAVIGIHGPLGADSLIGTTGAYLSHGCIRIPIPYLVQLRDVPAGSPISVCG
jgi:L,D-transpeptidase catalytic domain